MVKRLLGNIQCEFMMDLQKEINENENDGNSNESVWTAVYNKRRNETWIC